MEGKEHESLSIIEKIGIATIAVPSALIYKVTGIDLVGIDKEDKEDSSDDLEEIYGFSIFFKGRFAIANPGLKTHFLGGVTNRLYLIEEMSKRGYTEWRRDKQGCFIFEKDKQVDIQMKGGVS